MNDRSFEKNGLLVSTKFLSVPPRITVVSPEIVATDGLESKEGLIIELSFSHLQKRAGLVGLSVYIATEPVDEIVRQQLKFNTRAPRGHCPSYRLGGSWLFSLDGSATLYEETSGFQNSRFLGRVLRGQELAYPGGSRYLMKEQDARLSFSAITDRGVNSVSITKKPVGLEELVNSFEFSVGIR